MALNFFQHTSETSETHAHDNFNAETPMKYSVVVVDDSKFVHKLIEKLFDPELFNVHFFTSAEETKKALDTFASQGRNVDLVLLDIYLQEGTKDESMALLEFLTKARKRTRVIVMSGRLSSREFAEFYYNIGSWCENAELLEDEIWKPLLTEAINTCGIFLLLLTHDTLRSEYMKQEIIQAFNRKKRDGNRFLLIPVLYNIQANEVPRQISSMHCVDLTSADRRTDQIRSLISSIRKILKPSN